MSPTCPLFLLVFSPLLASTALGDTAPVLMPPPTPRHERRMVDSASDLARDLTEVVAFLEQGQSYFRAFKKGTHTKEENAAMLRFLEAYEKEREIAKKEASLLNAWVQTKSDLEPIEDKLEGKQKSRQ
ncbi:MAG: hypothetical protein HY553_20650 [Elusimicrobia bacterium]|nr:hypothetical protein [Elusimicrobiota bacterium]